jgi:WD40 repeat protein
MHPPEDPPPNPYVGPPPFKEADAARFFGRDKEAQLLLDMVRSERVVLLFSQSGAGKTSLLNARLIPSLRSEGCEVLPVARLDAVPPAGLAPRNVYSFSTLWHLEGGAADLAALAGRTLDAHLRSRPAHPDGKRRPRVLIFDQFEEIFHTRRSRPDEERREFFRQLSQCLRADASLAVVLALREDHLAGLEPYAIQLPGQLQTRFRLEQLRPPAAIAAVARPAELAGRPFAPGVAEQLVDALCREHGSGQAVPVIGEHVLPVQLQVVCFRLWEKLQSRPAGAGGAITAQDVQESGDVAEALEQFYVDAVARAAADSGLPAARLRSWCETRLITPPPARIRSQVLQEAEATGGLPNAAVDSLIESHLVRRLDSRGGKWCELAHDLFIDPILRSNERARPAEARELARRAGEWRQADRDRSYLYRGGQLGQALRWARQAPEMLAAEEQDFLAQSSQQEVAEQTRRTRSLRGFVGLLSLVAVLLVGWACYARQAEQVSSSRALAFEAISLVQVNPERSLDLIQRALDKGETAQAEGALHRILNGQPDRFRRGRSFALSAAATGVFAFDPQGRRFVAVGPDHGAAIWEAATGRRLLALGGHDAPLTSAAFSADGDRLATGDAAGRVLLRSAATAPPWGPAVTLETGSPVNDLAFQPGAPLLAVAGDEDGVTLWDVQSATRVKQLADAAAAAVLSVAFDDSGTLLAAGGEDGRAVVWEAASGRPVGEPRRHPAAVTRVVFGPAGGLATVSRDGRVRFHGGPWDAAPPRGPERAEGVTDLALAPNGAALVTARADGTVQVWDPEAGEELQTLALPDCGGALRIALRQGTLATACESRPPHAGGTVTLWTRPGEAPRPGPGAGILALGYLPADGGLLAVDRRGGTVLWDRAGRRRDLPALGRMPAAGGRLALGGGRLAAGGARGRARVWEVAPERTSRQWETGAGALDAVALSADGRLLATAAPAGDIRVWDLATGPARGTRLPSGPSAVFALAFAPRRDRLAAAAADGSLVVWRREAGGWKARWHTRPPAGDSDAALALAFSPDGAFLASAGPAGTIRLWDVAEGDVRLLEGHTATVVHLAFSPGGRHLASADAGRKVIVWDVASRVPLFDLPGVEAAFSPDGGELAIARADGAIHLEPMRIADLRDRAARLQERRVP